MSNSPEQEPDLESLILGEAASQQELELVEELARNFTMGMPKETVQEHICHDDDSGSLVCLSTASGENLPAGNYAMIALADMDTYETVIALSFDPDNELVNIHLPFSDYAYTDAINTADNLIHSGILDKYSLTAVSYVRTVCDYLEQGYSPDHIRAIIAYDGETEMETASNQIHVADLVRDVVMAEAKEKSIVIQQANVQTSDMGTASITFREFAGYTDEEIQDNAYPALEIRIEEPKATYYFWKDTAGRFACERVPHQSEVEEKEDDTWNETDYFVESTDISSEEPDFYSAELTPEEESEIQELYQYRPSSVHTEYIQGALMDAAMRNISIHTEQLQNPEPEQVSDRELQFGFVEHEFYEQGEPSVQAITREAIRSLNATLRLQQHPENAGKDDMPATQNTYVYSHNRVKRIEKFLSTKVTKSAKAPANEKVNSRADVSDIHVVSQNIMDELGEQNDPIAQMFSELYTQYEDVLGHTILTKVATELIKQTQEQKIREFYGKRINQWRLGASLVNAAATS